MMLSIRKLVLLMRESSGWFPLGFQTKAGQWQTFQGKARMLTEPPILLLMLQYSVAYSHVILKSFKYTTTQV